MKIQNIDFVKSRTLKRLEFYIRTNLIRGWEIHGEILKEGEFFVQPMIYRKDIEILERNRIKSIYFS